MIEMTKVSSKGQVVIPARIREELQLEEGTRLIVQQLQDVIVLKKINVEQALKEFDRLTEEGEKTAQRMGITNEEDIDRIIHEGRMRRRAERSS